RSRTGGAPARATARRPRSTGHPRARCRREAAREPTSRSSGSAERSRSGRAARRRPCAAERIRRPAAWRPRLSPVGRRLAAVELESLDFLYMPSGDPAAELEYFERVLGAQVAFAIEAFGTRVAMVRLAEGPPALLLAGHLEGER